MHPDKNDRVGHTLMKTSPSPVCFIHLPFSPPHPFEVFDLRDAATVLSITFCNT